LISASKTTFSFKNSRFWGLKLEKILQFCLRSFLNFHPGCLDIGNSLYICELFKQNDPFRNQSAQKYFQKKKNFIISLIYQKIFKFLLTKKDETWFNKKLHLHVGIYFKFCKNKINYFQTLIFQFLIHIFLLPPTGKNRYIRL